MNHVHRELRGGPDPEWVSCNECIKRDTCLEKYETVVRVAAELDRLIGRADGPLGSQHEQDCMDALADLRAALSALQEEERR